MLAEIDAPALCWNPLRALEALDRANEHLQQRSASHGALTIKLLAEVGLLFNLLVAVTAAALMQGWSRTLVAVGILLGTAGVIRMVRTWYRHASALAVISRSS